MRTFRISKAFNAAQEALSDGDELSTWEVRAPFSFDEWHVFIHCTDGTTGTVDIDYGIGAAVKIAVDGSPFPQADYNTNIAGESTLALILDAKSPKLHFDVTRGNVTTLTVYVVASQKGATPAPDAFPTTTRAATRVKGTSEGDAGHVE
tara:strand:- start:309 stop:755 length:447 start_codon:yes stop_codon:yes gene_type:complete